MHNSSTGSSNGQQSSFIHDLTAYTTDHRARYWRGSFAEFLEEILPPNPRRFTRTSHQYVYDMLRWYAKDRNPGNDDPSACKQLFLNELFGIDSALDRVVEYFKAASAGSDVGRRRLPVGKLITRRPSSSPASNSGPTGLSTWS